MISLRQGTLAFLFAAASATVAQSQSLSGLPITCKGERISRIDVDASPPFRITGDQMWHRWGRWAAKQHVTTRDAVIRRYLAGETLIEAYWKSVEMPGQGIFVGEPLARPYSPAPAELQGKAP